MISPSGTASVLPRPTPADSAKEPLQVRIPVAVKRRFKAHAALQGIEPNALFVQVWAHYEATHTASPERGKS